MYGRLRPSRCEHPGLMNRTSNRIYVWDGCSMPVRIIEHLPDDGRANCPRLSRLKPLRFGPRTPRQDDPCHVLRVLDGREMSGILEGEEMGISQEFLCASPLRNA